MGCSDFFFNDTATTEIYTLSLHDALPIYHEHGRYRGCGTPGGRYICSLGKDHVWRKADDLARVGLHTLQVTGTPRSEEHTSELQSRQYLVCRLLLEKKNHPRLPHSLTPVR